MALLSIKSTANATPPRPRKMSNNIKNPVRIRNGIIVREINTLSKPLQTPNSFEKLEKYTARYEMYGFCNKDSRRLKQQYLLLLPTLSIGFSRRTSHLQEFLPTLDSVSSDRPIRRTKEVKARFWCPRSVGFIHYNGDHSLNRSLCCTRIFTHITGILKYSTSILLCKEPDPSWSCSQSCKNLCFN